MPINQPFEVRTTLNTIARQANDFSAFCDEFGYDEYAVRERGGHEVEVILTSEQALRYDLLKPKDNDDSNET